MLVDCDYPPRIKEVFGYLYVCVQFSLLLVWEDRFSLEMRKCCLILKSSVLNAVLG